MNKIALLIISIILISCSQTHYKDPHILITTRLGDIEVELYPEKAPKTVASFLAYIDSGIYKHTSFYRVLKADDQQNPLNTGIIQGGVYQTKSELVGTFPGIVHESTKLTGLSHTDGTISLASTGPGTATTEFFICIGDQSPLDAGRRGTADGQGFAAFGKVFKGMDIVRKIQNQHSQGDRFEEKIEIINIERL